MAQAIFIGSNIYRGSVYGAQHPLSIQRVPAVTDLCRALGWLPADRYRTSPRAKPAHLRRFHTDAYLEALQRAEDDQAVSDTVRARHGLGTLSNPIFAEMFRRPATACGGGLLAAELVRDGGVVHNPGGGTHHGFPDRASGFCFLNEPVLTILRLLEMGIAPVAYVDLDAHHGDGVQAAFHGSDRVRVISMHEAGRWPFTGQAEDRAGGAALNLPVPRGLNDTEAALLLDEVIVPSVAALQPQVIFLQMGADSLLEDPLSRLALSNRAYLRALDALRPMAPRLIVSGGGGYNPWSTARLWAAIWGRLSGQEMPDHLPPEASAVLRGLNWHRKGRPSETLLTTLLDAPREGEIRDAIRDLARRQSRAMV
ncbi:acetoin utilization protein AcuC [Tropicibacter alexandrii]|uniref:acetoin utilization protein AcuC n=1 Tax=Tropicibacter alexandrii TaxID=2267683 RepID=UPI000EF4FF09|nr:acetoin utilization protein AcuC [Tropicibacter alexandrii]